MFTCTFLGFPSPALIWTFNGRATANGTVFDINQETHVDSSSGIMITRSHISFVAHSTAFTGRYKCRAAGNTFDTEEFQLNVHGKCAVHSSGYAYSSCGLL
jgi:hypothetical protein